MKKNVISVFCGSGIGKTPIYREAAQELGLLMAQRGKRLMFGGCAAGLMKVVSDAVRDGGQTVIAAVIEGIKDPVDLREGDQKVELPTLQDRKRYMIEESDAMIALPGGMGTLDEISDVYSMIQLRKTQKPLILLNINGFYEPFLALMRHMNGEGFLNDKYTPMFIVCNTPREALDELEKIDRIVIDD